MQSIGHAALLDIGERMLRPASLGGLSPTGDGPQILGVLHAREQSQIFLDADEQVLRNLGLTQIIDAVILYVKSDWSVSAEVLEGMLLPFGLTPRRFHTSCC